LTGLVTLAYVVCCVSTAVTAVWLVRARAQPHVRVVLAFAIVEIVLAVGLGLVTGNTFDVMRLLAWGAFVVAPVLLFVLAILGGRTKPWLTALEGGLALGLVAFGVDAFWIEPHALEVNSFTVRSSKIDRPYVIAVLSDLQTDSPGAYERRAVALAMAAEPDLIVLPGDYLQIDDGYDAAKIVFQDIMGDLHAPLGVYAVEGNVDWRAEWQDLFDAETVTTFPRTETVPVDEAITLTGLTLRDSFAARTLPHVDGFHIAVGHYPDFALGDDNVDLLLAGHTHGGQVQLPFIGPLITLSAVPRDWAAGLTETRPGRTLVVSRGIGLERQGAPRLRFLCRPEVVIVRLEPM
jgi:predicted MPP superfamily phosphohydrolase